MRWKLIFFLSLFGVMMGLASIYGFLKTNEVFFWVISGFIIAGILGFSLKQKLFINGFTAGFINALAAGLIQFIFFDIYLTNNPEVASELSKLPADYDPRFFFLASSPVIGIVNGIVIGILSIAAFKIINRQTGKTINLF